MSAERLAEALEVVSTAVTWVQGPRKIKLAKAADTLRELLAESANDESISEPEEAGADPVIEDPVEPEVDEEAVPEKGRRRGRKTDSE